MNQSWEAITKNTDEELIKLLVKQQKQTKLLLIGIALVSIAIIFLICKLIQTI